MRHSKHLEIKFLLALIFFFLSCRHNSENKLLGDKYAQLFSIKFLDSSYQKVENRYLLLSNEECVQYYIGRDLNFYKFNVEDVADKDRWDQDKGIMILFGGVYKIVPISKKQIFLDSANVHKMMLIKSNLSIK